MTKCQQELQTLKKKYILLLPFLDRKHFSLCSLICVLNNSVLKADCCFYGVYWSKQNKAEISLYDCIYLPIGFFCFIMSINIMFNIKYVCIHILIIENTISRQSQWKKQFKSKYSTHWTKKAVLCYLMSAFGWIQNTMRYKLITR